jgi:hypothetical protein
VEVGVLIDRCFRVVTFFFSGLYGHGFLGDNGLYI